ASINRPYIAVGRVYASRPTPPDIKDDIGLGNLVRVDVEYPDPPNGLTVPDEWLAPAINELRKNLERAVQLESELGGFGLSVGPIVAEDGDDDGYSRAHGLSGSVFRFASLFERLLEFDVLAAHQEFLSWPVSDDSIFARLRIWACGKERLIPAEAFGPV